MVNARGAGETGPTAHLHDLELPLQLVIVLVLPHLVPKGRQLRLFRHLFLLQDFDALAQVDPLLVELLLLRFERPHESRRFVLEIGDLRFESLDTATHTESGHA